MSFHRLLEKRLVDGRMREADSLIDYRGPPVPHFEPLEVAEHMAWLRAMNPPGRLRSAA